MTRAGARAGWDTIPAALRAGVDEALGAPVIAAMNLVGGFSPGPAAKCTLATGDTVFVKAAGTDLNPDSPDIHRREGAVLAQLPADHPAPRLIGVIDDGDWVALLIEWVDGRMPTAPLDASDIDRTVRVATMLADRGTGLRPEGLQPFHRQNHSLFDNWAHVAAEPPCMLDEWSRAHLAALAELETHAPEASIGRDLVHGDLRTDNMLFIDPQPGEAAVRVDVVVDWPGASIGAGWLDTVGLLPALHLDGGPIPQDAFERFPVAARADPDAVTAVLAAFTGYFTRQSLLAPPRGLPTLRAFQAEQARIARAWLAERIGLASA